MVVADVVLAAVAGEPDASAFAAVYYFVALIDSAT